MRIIGLILGGALLSTALIFLIGSGIWLLSLTSYPFWPTVGGGSLIAAGIGAIIGGCVALDI